MEEGFNTNYFKASLYLTFFSTMIPGLITGLLLIDISQTFNSTIAYVSQIRSLSSILAVLAALLIGALSVKLHSKHLILLGLMCMLIVGIGSSLSPTLSILFIAYAFQGLGTGFTAPMINSLIGEHLEPEERPKTMGYLVSAASVAYIISPPIISYLNNNYSWRSAFLFYQFPLVLVSIILAARYLPLSNKENNGELSYRKGVQQIMESRSSLYCLLAVSLGNICWMSLLIFSTSFLRELFGVPVSTASLVMVIMSGSFMVGSLVSGYLFNRFGGSKVTGVTTFLLGVSTILFTFSPFFFWGVVLGCFGFFFGGLRVPGANGLALEQVPEYRGVMMSLNTCFSNVGNFLGTFIGGFLLVQFGWGSLGTVLGLIGVLSSLVYLVFIKDPKRG